MNHQSFLEKDASLSSQNVIKSSEVEKKMVSHVVTILNSEMILLLFLLFGKMRFGIYLFFLDAVPPPFDPTYFFFYLGLTGG